MGPKKTTTFNCPEKYLKDIEKAADMLNRGKSEFISLAAHEYAKTVIAIHDLHKDLDPAELQDRAFATIRAHRSAFLK